MSCGEKGGGQFPISHISTRENYSTDKAYQHIIKIFNQNIIKAFDLVWFIYFFEKKLNLISSNLGAPQILNLFFFSQ